jgi:FMN reductase [NAD(P)H]
MNQIINALKNHRSHRKYLDKKVSKEYLAAIAEAAQAAPSWINGQQISIIVVQDGERKQRLAELCGNQQHINEAPVYMIFCADFYRAKLASEKEGKNFKAIEEVDTLLVGATDVGLAMANSITAAESLGLGTVPIGGIRRNSIEVIEFLELPKYVVPICGLCVGYPVEDPGLKPRLPKESILHHEYYNKDQDAKLMAYNQTFKLYLQERGDEPADWTNRVASFYDKAYYPSNGTMLKQQGFLSKDIQD